MDLKPSHLGSYEASGGIDGTDLASIGETGGMTGNFISSFSRVGGERIRPLRKSALSFGLSRTQVFQALLQRGDFAQPPPFVRLDQALLGVLSHLVDAAELGRIDSQKSASGAGFSELDRGT